MPIILLWFALAIFAPQTQSTVYYQYIFDRQVIAFPSDGQTVEVGGIPPGGMRRVILYGDIVPYGAYDAFTCRHSPCAVGIFYYNKNSAPFPVGSVVGGLRLSNLVIREFDSSPIVAFTNSSVAFTVPVGSMMNTPLVKGISVALVAMTIVVRFGREFVGYLYDMYTGDSESAAPVDDTVSDSALGETDGAE